MIVPLKIGNWLLSIALAAGLSHTASASVVHVEVFSAKSASVNSFIIYDSVGSLIVDSTRSSKDALRVAKLARAHGTDPAIIFITHGHPDHFLGMGALKQQFPDAKILVASQGIKDDILEFAEMATKNRWIEDEPLMKPKSVKNPRGFDYQQEIQVMSGNTLGLPGGERLEVFSQFLPTESAHETTLFSKDLNALFASDLAYNGVHLWLGNGVNRKAMRNWQSELQKIYDQYSLVKIKIYPGHGMATDVTVFKTDLNYISAIRDAVVSSKTEAEAKVIMIEKYPHWESADFILNESLKNLFKVLK
jgi:glyoxylase-like metal-dependent hydrolase (beta-lactamase superfamily II)